MSNGLIFSLVVNIIVGVYFARFYPRSVRKNFPNGQPPPFFALLLKILPPVGVLLIVGSVIYGVLTALGAFAD
jgi:branched-subunit amino acid transport protein AzlD